MHYDQKLASFDFKIFFKIKVYFDFLMENENNVDIDNLYLC